MMSLRSRKRKFLLVYQQLSICDKSKHVNVLKPYSLYPFPVMHPFSPLIFSAFLCLFGAVIRAQTPEDTYQVINSFPHNASSFTQGLIYHNGFIYESRGLYGSSGLRKLDLETGATLQNRVVGSSFFGEGMTLLNGKIYQLTWRERTAFVYDADTFDLLDALSYTTEGWGLTHNGQELIMSDGSQYLYFRDPETFAELRRVAVRDGGSLVDDINELEYIHGEVWANIWLSDRIARINPITGEVNRWVDLTDIIDPSLLSGSQSLLNGIAYDAATDRLFVTGKLWPTLFEVVTHPLDGSPPSTTLSLPATQGVPFDFSFPTFRDFRYRLVTASDLSGATWSGGGALLIGTGYSDTLSVVSAPSASNLFYSVETLGPN